MNQEKDQEIALLKGEIFTLKEKVVELEFLAENLNEQLKLALMKTYTQSSEALNSGKSKRVKHHLLKPEDINIFDESSALIDDLNDSNSGSDDQDICHKDLQDLIASEDTQKAPVSKGKTGRKALPDYIPMYDVNHELTLEERTAEDGSIFEKFSEEVTFELEFVPASVKRRRNRFFLYAVPGREELGVRKKKIARLIPGSIASPSFISHILNSKFSAHLPFYRQEKILEECDIFLKRGTMSNWTMKVGAVLDPLIERIKELLVSTAYIHADETPVTVLTHAQRKKYSQLSGQTDEGGEGVEESGQQDSGQQDSEQQEWQTQTLKKKDSKKEEPPLKNSRQSYMWVYGNSLENLICFDYQDTRAGKHPLQFLQTFKGHLQCDAYSGYDQIARNKDVTRAGCMAHCRRYFNDCLKVNPKHKQANEAVKIIGTLYTIENDIRALEEADGSTLGFPEILAMRKKRSIPILNHFKLWLDDMKTKTLPSSLFGKALTYALGNFEPLTEYAKTGHINIDNNFAENAIRPFALGRKNWLFLGNKEGAKNAANIYTIISNAKSHNLNIGAYLTHLLENIPSAKTKEDQTNLLPHKIKLSHPHLLLQTKPPSG